MEKACQGQEKSKPCKGPKVGVGWVLKKNLKGWGG